MPATHPKTRGPRFPKLLTRSVEPAATACGTACPMLRFALPGYAAITVNGTSIGSFPRRRPMRKMPPGSGVSQLSAPELLATAL